MRSRYHSGMSMVALLLFIAIPCISQEKIGTWYGSATVSGGTNFDTNWYELMTGDPGNGTSKRNGSFDGKIGWKSKKLDIRFLAGGSSAFQMSSFTGFNYNIAERDTSMTLDLSQRKNISSDISLGTELSYQLGRDDKLFFRIHHKQHHQTPYNSSYGLKVDQAARGQSQEEQGTYTKMSYLPKLDWEHSFSKNSHKLQASLSWDYAKDDRTTIWTIMKGRYATQEFHVYDSTGRVYRITPQYVDSDINLLVSYSAPKFLNVNNLNIQFALNALRNRDKDSYSGANLVEGRWVDSLRLRESFDYVSLYIEPRIRAEYSVGQFSFDGLFAPQYFTDRLTNSVEVERFDAGRVDWQFDLKSQWIPSESHRVCLRVGNHVKRPDYLQLCWFQRPGVLSNELLQGNPDLRPTSTYTALTEYAFTSGKFNAGLEIGYKSVYDQIEQVYNMTEIDGKSFRVYTWINAGRSETENLRLIAGWKGKVILAGASANVNHFYGISADGKRSVGSYDMEIKANVSVKLPWDVTILSDGRYQSAITRVYGKMSSYIALNARINKSFRHFYVFVEGRDLLDKPVVVETYSEDGTEGRYEERKDTRRLYKLGGGFSF